eukprot:4418956-Amphidinium_carterae.3
MGSRQMGRTCKGATIGSPFEIAAIIPFWREAGNLPMHSETLNTFASIACAASGRRFSSDGLHQSSEWADFPFNLKTCSLTDLAVCGGSSSTRRTHLTKSLSGTPDTVSPAPILFHSRQSKLACRCGHITSLWSVRTI